jgi:hypothetical protein
MQISVEGVACDVVSRVKVVSELNAYPKLFATVDSAKPISDWVEVSGMGTLTIDDLTIPFHCEQIEDYRPIDANKVILCARAMNEATHVWMHRESQYYDKTWQIYQRKASESEWAFIVRCLGGNHVNQVSQPAQQLIDRFADINSVFVRASSMAIENMLFQKLGWLRSRSSRFIGFSMLPKVAQGISLLVAPTGGRENNFGLQNEGMGNWSLVPNDGRVLSGTFWLANDVRCYQYQSLNQLTHRSAIASLIEPVGDAIDQINMSQGFYRFRNRLFLSLRTEVTLGEDSIESARCWIAPVESIRCAYPSLSEASVRCKATCNGWSQDGSLLTFKPAPTSDWQVFESENTLSEPQAISARLYTPFPPRDGYAGLYGPPIANQETEIEITNFQVPVFNGAFSVRQAKLEPADLTINVKEVRLHTQPAATSADAQKGIVVQRDRTEISNDLDATGKVAKVHGDLKVGLDS